MRRWLFALVLLMGCYDLDYNAVGIHHSVVTGGVAEIDAGNVVDYNGLPGIWLAGHRTTHGAVFRNLTGARIGDTVCVYGRCYRVTRVIHWPSHVSPGYLGPVVLQTSLPVGVLLVVCR
jgi:hypothetical protein